MKEKILEAFDRLGIELRYIEAFEAYYFVELDTNFLLVYDESHEGVLKIEVPNVINCENYSTSQIYGVMERINSRYPFLKAFVSTFVSMDCVYLSYERKLMPSDKDLDVVILWMILNLEQGCHFAHSILDELVKASSDESDAKPETNGQKIHVRYKNHQFHISPIHSK